VWPCGAGHPLTGCRAMWKVPEPHD
jgi:hypothetical protein